MIALVDMDKTGDGQVNLEEFSKMAKGPPAPLPKPLPKKKEKESGNSQS
jgi:hypothetical protein